MFSVYQYCSKLCHFGYAVFPPNFIIYNKQQKQLSGEMAYVNTVSTLTSLNFHLHLQIKLTYTHDVAGVNQLHVNVRG
jgi:hypothetical protein